MEPLVLGDASVHPEGQITMRELAASERVSTLNKAMMPFTKNLVDAHCVDPSVNFYTIASPRYQVMRKTFPSSETVLLRG